MTREEAPEKIYVKITHPISDEYTEIIAFEDGDGIEYIRTDAFIKKVEKFLEDKLTEKECKFNWGDWTKVKSGDTPIASFMRAFRNYMKGDKV